MEDEKSTEQSNNRPWLYKKGQSGNPKGRPKGISLKEYAKMKFASMTDDEKEEYFDGLDKKIIWAMGEGNPDSKVDIPLQDKVTLSPEALALALEYEERLKNKNASGTNLNNSVDN